MNRQEKNVKKIIIAGLDNSGKSSIVMSFQGINNLSKFAKSASTRGINQIQLEQFSKHFVIWDIGGQNENREEFINNFNNIISKTEKIIYVVDIQDKKRYDLALNYLQKIIKSLEPEKQNLEFSIFLHKFDPGLDLSEKEVTELIESIKNIIPSRFKYDISKTTIFTVFKKTTIIE
jgi:small GTP-binding protein